MGAVRSNLIETFDWGIRWARSDLTGYLTGRCGHLPANTVVTHGRANSERGKARQHNVAKTK